MRYFWCWLFPPLGLLTCGRPGLAFVNLLLCCTCVGVPFAVLWSFLVARDFYADSRNRELIDAFQGSHGAMPVASIPARRPILAALPVHPTPEASEGNDDEEELPDEGLQRFRNPLIGVGVGVAFCVVAVIGFIALRKPEPRHSVVAEVSEKNLPTPTSPPTPTTISTPKPKPKPDTEPVKPPAGDGETLTAPDLLRRFLSSRESSKEHFNGATLTVTGVVPAPATSYTGGEVGFRLFGFREDGPCVWCRMAPGRDIMEARFPAGTEVTVRGRCVGVGVARGPAGTPLAKAEDVVLTDCVLVRDPIPAGTDHPNAIVQDGIEFRITAVQLGHPIIVLSSGRRRGLAAPTKEKQLVFRLQVRNARPDDARKPGAFTYALPGGTDAQLVDEKGNSFEYARLDVRPEPQSSVAEELVADPKTNWRFKDESTATTLEPDQTETYYLVFSPLQLGKGNRLFLKLQSSALLVPKPTTLVFRFEQKVVESLPVALSNPTPPPATPKTPSLDPVLEAKIATLGTQLAKGKTPTDRIKAAEELLKHGPKAKNATDALCQAILDPAPPVRVAALDAMKAVNPDLYGPVSIITTPLTDFDFQFDVFEKRREALAQLVKLKAEGQPAVPILVVYKRLVSRPGGWPHAVAVVKALVNLAPDDPAVVTVLVTGLLKDEAAEARFAAAKSLAWTTVTKESVAALATAVRSDPVPEVRLAAVDTLAGIGLGAKGALKSLEAAKSDGDARVREAAREAIEKVK
ncbi:MAG: HEAT repeat domain-containing protein [Planctomycetes bacterium]|nr:HEAT repeat domain-containing protein [Planctomycetota bacterium]